MTTKVLALTEYQDRQVADSATLNIGTETGTVANTRVSDDVEKWTLNPAAGALDVIVDIPLQVIPEDTGDITVGRLRINHVYPGTSSNIEVHFWRWDDSTWRKQGDDIVNVATETNWNKTGINPARFLDPSTGLLRVKFVAASGASALDINYINIMTAGNVPMLSHDYPAHEPGIVDYKPIREGRDIYQNISTTPTLWNTVPADAGFGVERPTKGTMGLSVLQSWQQGEAPRLVGVNAQVWSVALADATWRNFIIHQGGGGDGVDIPTPDDYMSNTRAQALVDYLTNGDSIPGVNNDGDLKAMLQAGALDGNGAAMQTQVGYNQGQFQTSTLTLDPGPSAAYITAMQSAVSAGDVRQWFDNTHVYSWIAGACLLSALNTKRNS